MGNAEFEWNPKIVKDKVLVEITGSEELTQDEFLANYSERAAEQQQIQSQITTMRSELKDLIEIKETPELKELKQKLQLAEKLVRKEKLLDGLRKAETRLVQIKKGVDQLTPLAKKLQEK